MIASTKKLREQRHALAMQMRALVEAGGEAGMSAEQLAQFDKLEVDCKQLEETVRAQERLSLIEESAAKAKDETLRDEFRANPKTGDDRPTRQEQEFALRAWCMNGLKGQKPIPEEYTRAAEKCGVNLDSQEWNVRLATRAPADRKEATALTRATTTAQSITTTGGGHTIQNEMMAAIEVALLAYSNIRSVCRVVRTPTGATWPIPTIDDTTNKSVILAINVAADVEALVFGQTTMTSYKYTTKQALVPFELMQDSTIDLPSFIGTMFGIRAARGTNAHFTVGVTSDTQPDGIVTGSVVGTTGSDVHTVTYAELEKLYQSVDPEYRNDPSCGYMMSDGTLGVVKRLVDGSSRPLWLPALSGIAGDFPDTVLGKRVTVNQDMATIASATTGTGGAKAVLFGAFNRFIIRDVMDLQVLRLNERYAEKAQVGFVGFHRHDSKLVVASTASPPVRHFITKST